MKMNDRNIWLELWRRLHIDLWLFIGLVVITGYGMFVLYSASGANGAVPTEILSAYCSLFIWYRNYFVGFGGYDWNHQ